MEKPARITLINANRPALAFGLGSVWLTPLILVIFGGLAALVFVLMYVALTAAVGRTFRKSPYYGLFWIPSAVFTLGATFILIGPFAFFTLSGKAAFYAGYGIEMPNANMAMFLFAVIAHYSVIPLVALWLGLSLGAPKSISSLVINYGLLNLTLAVLVTVGVNQYVTTSAMDARLEQWHQHPRFVKIKTYPPQTENEKATYAWLEKFTNNSSLRVPVEFSAMAVDQDNQPLPGVTFDYELDYKKNTATTGTDGKIFISANEGHQMSLKPKKEGYWLQDPDIGSGEDYFVFDSCLDRDFYPSNPDTPVVYHFRKQLPAEPFYRWWRVSNLVAGRKDYIDPLTGRKANATEDGLLWLSAAEDPKGVILTFGLVNGGVVNGDGILDPLAPEEGYQSNLEVLFPANRYKDLQIFFVTPDKHYGSLNLRRPFDHNGNVQLEYTVVLNPSGSRNLRVLGNDKQINHNY